MASVMGLLARKQTIPLIFRTYKLAYLKDSGAAAHSVDSDIFQSSDSSICTLQDLTLTFIS